MCNKLGLKEARRRVDDKNKYTLVFLYAAEDEDVVQASMKKTGRDAPLLELTYNWDTEDYGEARYFGHLAYEVDDIYATCDRLMKAGVTINRPPRDGNMAFVRSPDKHSIELLQKGQAAAAEGAVGLDAQHREMVTGPSARRSVSEGGLPHAAKLSIPRRVFNALWRLRPSSSGLGHRPFTAVTGVRVP